MALREGGVARATPELAPGRISTISCRRSASATTGTAPHTGAPCTPATKETSDIGIISCDLLPCRRLKWYFTSMKTQNPNFREQVRWIFEAAPFVGGLGLELADLGPGWCESVLPVAAKHLQQDGYIHAGVQATAADHTAGGAAGTLVKPDQTVLTVEFKINLLRPAQGECVTKSGAIT